MSSDRPTFATAVTCVGVWVDHDGRVEEVSADYEVGRWPSAAGEPSRRPGPDHVATKL